jgi:hypothetical protein
VFRVVTYRCPIRGLRQSDVAVVQDKQERDGTNSCPGLPWMYLAFTLSAQCLTEGCELLSTLMFVSAAVVLRWVVDEDCADIITLPRGNGVGRR